MENPQNFMETQTRVFQHEQQEKNIENIFSFIIANGALFRYFSQHLPKELTKVWDAASTEEENVSAVKELGSHYETFREEIRATLEALDPEAMTALSDAAENGEVDTAYTILQTYFEMRDDAQTELLVA